MAVPYGGGSGHGGVPARVASVLAAAAPPHRQRRAYKPAFAPPDPRALRQMQYRDPLGFESALRARVPVERLTVEGKRARATLVQLQWLTPPAIEQGHEGARRPWVTQAAAAPHAGARVVDTSFSAPMPHRGARYDRGSSPVQQWGPSGDTRIPLSLPWSQSSQARGDRDAPAMLTPADLPLPHSDHAGGSSYGHDKDAARTSRAAGPAHVPAPAQVHAPAGRSRMAASAAQSDLSNPFAYAPPVRATAPSPAAPQAAPQAQPRSQPQQLQRQFWSSQQAHVDLRGPSAAAGATAGADGGDLAARLFGGAFAGTMPARSIPEVWDAHATSSVPGITAGALGLRATHAERGVAAAGMSVAQQFEVHNAELARATAAQRAVESTTAPTTHKNDSDARRHDGGARRSAAARAAKESAHSGGASSSSAASVGDVHLFFVVGEGDAAGGGAAQPVKRKRRSGSASGKQGSRAKRSAAKSTAGDALSDDDDFATGRAVVQATVTRAVAPARDPSADACSPAECAAHFDVVASSTSQLTELVSKCEGSSALSWSLLGGNSAASARDTRAQPYGAVFLVETEPPRSGAVGEGADAAAAASAAAPRKLQSYMVPLLDDSDAADATLRERWDSIARILCAPGPHKVCYDLQAMLRQVLSQCSSLPPGTKHLDPRVAMWLLDPDTNSQAENVQLRAILRQQGVAFEDCPGLDPAIDGMHSARGAAVRLETTLAVTKVLYQRMVRVGIEVAFNAIEMPLVHTLACMELKGIAIDGAQLPEVTRQLIERRDDIVQRAHECVGHSFAITSPKEVAAVIWDELCLQLPAGGPSNDKTKTHKSTAENILEALSDQHPLPGLIIEFRKLFKVQTTYTEPLAKLVVSGRVYTQLNQLNTATGRLSSSNPNLQNVPTNEGRSKSVALSVRGLFRADPGRVLISFDYSQVEIRVLAYMVNDAALGVKSLAQVFHGGGGAGAGAGASAGAGGGGAVSQYDIYVRMAGLVFKQPLIRVTDAQRAQAKMVCLGIIYGLGVHETALKLHVSEAEAKRIKSTLLRQFPAIAAFCDKAKATARRCGFVETISGRRRYLPDAASDNTGRRAYAERQAVNSIIQGSAADMIKVAMSVSQQALAAEFPESSATAGAATSTRAVAGTVAASGASTGAYAILQIHDELVVECPDDAAMVNRCIGVVRDCMERQCLATLNDTVSQTWRATGGKRHWPGLAAGGRVGEVVPAPWSIPLVVNTKVGTDWGHMDSVSV